MSDQNEINLSDKDVPATEEQPKTPEFDADEAVKDKIGGAKRGVADFLSNGGMEEKLKELNIEAEGMTGENSVNLKDILGSKPPAEKPVEAISGTYNDNSGAAAALLSERQDRLAKEAAMMSASEKTPESDDNTENTVNTGNSVEDNVKIIDENLMKMKALSILSQNPLNTPEDIDQNLAMQERLSAQNEVLLKENEEILRRTALEQQKPVEAPAEKKTAPSAENQESDAPEKREFSDLKPREKAIVWTNNETIKSHKEKMDGMTDPDDIKAMEEKIKILEERNKKFGIYPEEKQEPPPSDVKGPKTSSAPVTDVKAILTGAIPQTAQPTAQPVTPLIVTTAPDVSTVNVSETYEIQGGDTFYDIVQELKDTDHDNPMSFADIKKEYEDIAAFNGIEDPNQIKEGAIITIPSDEQMAAFKSSQDQQNGYAQIDFDALDNNSNSGGMKMGGMAS